MVYEEQQQQKRTLGEDPVPARSHTAEHVPGDVRTINGWGADLDPKDRPAVPRELPSDVHTARGDVKHRQTPRTKVFQSNEHPDLTPVFGESCPPSGLSGFLRGYAYQFGEATNRHWMTLMAADRVNIIERFVGDLFRRPDNYVKEKAWGTRIKYAASAPPRNNVMMIGLAVAGAAVIGLAISSALKDD